MTSRPMILPGVLADMTAAAPARLQKKLDKSPNVASSWSWSADDTVWTVAAGEETVRLQAAVIGSADDVACTCLLAPRCFHVLAVLSVLDIAAETDVEADIETGVETDSQIHAETGSGTAEAAETLRTAPQVAAVERPVLTAGQQQAVADVRRVLAKIVSAGLRAAGTVLQSRLLRAIHACRSEGLHRLAAATLRIMTNIRQVRVDSDAFACAQASADLLEALEVAHCLSPAAGSDGAAGLKMAARQTATPAGVAASWIGTARRRFHPVSHLKLYGLCCEPILTRSGYSGVVTWMMDDDGWLCTLSDVQPGGADRIPQAWRSGVSVAGLALPHRELSRRSLLISKATRSRDGRLGGAESARAVAVDGAGWDAAPILAAFARSYEEQVDGAFAARRLPEAERPAGADLLFLEVTVLGCAGADLIVRTHCARVLRLGIQIDTDGVSFRENIVMLSRAPGLRIRCVVRIDFQRAGCGLLLSVGPPTDVSEGPQLRFEEAVCFHADFGLDVIERGQLTTAERSPVTIDPEAAGVVEYQDQEDVLTRWLQAIVLGGRHAVPTGAVDVAVQDAGRLNRQLRPTAAAVLCRLVESAVATQTDILGVRFPVDDASLAENWLAAAIVRRATVEAVQQDDWLATGQTLTGA